MSMDGSKMLSSEVVASLCSNYGLGKITQIDLASGGIENLNYFIELRHNNSINSYVLTVIKTPSYSGDSYFDMMGLLKQLEVPVPFPLKDLKGNLFTYVNKNEKALLQPRLPGDHISKVEIQHIQQLAATVAGLHQIPYKSLKGLPAHPRNLEWVVAQSKKLTQHLAGDNNALLHASVTKVKTFMRGLVKANVSKSIIHADLFRDNVLFNKEQLSGLLDFHHASIGYCMYDLAVIAIDWCRAKNGGLNPHFLYELLNVYNAKKPITSDELWLFKDFIVFAALNFWLSRLIGQLQNRERSKNPDQIKALLELLS